MTPRVVILSAFVSPLRSGAEACAEEVAARLGNDYDITIVAARMRRDLPRTETLPNGVRVVRVGIGATIDKWLYPFLAPLAARRLRPVLLHAVLETFAGLALHLCRYVVPKAKRLLTLQTTNRSFLKPTIIRSAHAVTAISTTLAAQAAHGKRTARLIPNGIDLPPIRDAVARTAKDPHRLLFVGRLEPMKGADTLLHAFAHIAAAHPSGTLIIVGDGSQAKPLKRLAVSLAIADRVRFLGRLTGPLLWNQYAEAAVFCGLSRSEALGNVFLEAQAAGCAVIATRVGGIPDSVKDGISGLLVPPDDPPAAAAAIERVLRDPALLRQLADAGVRNASDYDWDVIAEQYGEVYASLLFG